MAFTFNGFGTKFYGESDFRSDGSWITTEWIVALYIPLIPLRSFRFAQTHRGLSLGVVNSESYSVIEKLPICWPQVGRVYAFVVFTVGWVAAMLWLMLAKLKILSGPNAVYFVFPFIMVLAFPFFAAWWIRRKAFRSRL